MRVVGHRRLRRGVVALAVLAASGAAATVSPSVVLADGPGVGTPWVVSLGDSYISGEAGRWAGNSNNSSSSVDAAGSDAYFDNAGRTAETTPGCHRSPESAEIHIGGGVNSLNLAPLVAGLLNIRGFRNQSPLRPGVAS